MPWHNPEDLLGFNAIVYIKTFLMVTLPTLFFGASLFFVTGALSRNLVVVYTQGIILFVIFMLTKAITNEFLASHSRSIFANNNHFLRQSLGQR